MTQQTIRWLAGIPMTLVCSMAAFAQAAAPGSTAPPQKVVVVVVAAPGATGGYVTPEQFEQILKGMNFKDVEQALGKPRDERQYGNQPGSTWVYDVLEHGRIKGFVDFDIVGAVVATSKIPVLTGGSDSGQ